MRTTTVPSMLEVLARNYNNRNKAAALYEIGTVYLPQEGRELPDERPVITLGLYGDAYDFFALKGIVETLLRAAGVDGCEYESQRGGRRVPSRPLRAGSDRRQMRRYDRRGPSGCL